MAVRDQKITKRYAAYNGDCMEIMRAMKDESVHLSIYSPPFGGLYQYSSDERDMSNARTYEEMMAHYDYIIAELARVTMPGRLSCVHCIDIPLGNSGKGDNLLDFPGDIIRLHEKHKMHYAMRFGIWREPLWVRNSTMKKALAHQTIVNDACSAGNATFDFLLVFRKHGENLVPVTHATGLGEYAGEKKMPADVLKYKGYKGKQIENRYSHWIWRQYASSCWDDVRRDRVLPFRDSKEKDSEKHVHPLQLDVIERCVVLWSNPDETVFTPFMGVGSEVYGAVINGRRGVGAEFKTSYFKQALLNLADAEKRPLERQENLFDDATNVDAVDLETASAEL